MYCEIYTDDVCQSLVTKCKHIKKFSETNNIKHYTICNAGSGRITNYMSCLLHIWDQRMQDWAQQLTRDKVQTHSVSSTCRINCNPPNLHDEVQTQTLNPFYQEVRWQMLPRIWRQHFLSVRHNIRRMVFHSSLSNLIVMYPGVLSTPRHLANTTHTLFKGVPDTQTHQSKWSLKKTHQVTWRYTHRSMLCDNKTGDPLTLCHSYIGSFLFFSGWGERKLETASCGLEEVATSSLILTLLLHPLSAWHPHSTHPHTGQIYPAREKNCHEMARVLAVLQNDKNREYECFSQRKWK